MVREPMTMKVLINAISINEGGGEVVLRELLQALCLIQPNVVWYVVARPSILNNIPENPYIIKMSYSWANLTPFHHLYWYEVKLPRLIRRLIIDVCFSQTNFLPFKKLSCATLLLIHNAGYFCEEFNQLILNSKKNGWHRLIWQLKNKWVRSSIKKADTVSVQTNTLAKKISQELTILPENIATIPHGPGLMPTMANEPKIYPGKTVWRIGYITKFDLHKDFNSTFQAIKHLKDRGLHIKLIITLEERDITHYLQDSLHYYDIMDTIDNQGNITNSTHLLQLYQSLHLFIFPSICESFGFPLVEAMANALPIIASNIDNNREVAGVAANLFSKGNGLELANIIEQLMTNKEKYESASRKSLERAKDISWERTAKDIYDVLLKLATNK